MKTTPSAPRPALTKRESEVARLLCFGLRNGEIARRLGLSPLTIKAHIRSAFLRLGVASRVELALAYTGARIPRSD